MTDNMNERVTSLEANVDRFVDFVLQNQRDQQVQMRFHQTQIDELREGQRGLTQAMQDLIQFQREVITRFDAMQSEIRGLQTENRRLLDLYLNEEEPLEESN